MLVSLILLMAALLSWLSSIMSQAAATFGKPPITPQDPSTVSLALIGAGTLGVYFAISRRAWRRRETSRSIEISTTAETNMAEEVPSRGAA
jgi:hypothetical protein